MKKTKLGDANKVSNKRRNITSDTTEKQSIMRCYYKQLYTNKLNKVLRIYNLSSLNIEETDHQNRLIMRKEMESVITINKSPGPHSFTGEFY